MATSTDARTQRKIQGAIIALWEAGELSYKLKGVQKKIYKAAADFSDTLTTILSSRQLGKTTVLHVLAVETCIKNPGCIVKYATPKQNMIRKITKTAMRLILQDCPSYLKPEFNSQEKTWVFPNGSEIQLAGTDSGNAENLRGTTALLCIVDEAGFCDDLEYVVDSVMFPMTTTTDGKIVLASTPNFNEPKHDFHEHYVNPAMAQGKLLLFTIDESPLLSPTQIERIVSRYPGGRENPKFKCEYLCELVSDSSNFVVPEILDRVDQIVTDKIEMPMAFDGYVAMDIGFKDLTVALFAVYDFAKAQILILDELVMNGPSMTTSMLARNLMDKERMTLKTREGYYIPPYMRVADNDLKLINDLHQEHGVLFFPTKKDNREAALNKLRVWVADDKIRIHPRCKNLIYHLKNAQWNKNRTDFLRLKDNIAEGIFGGHCDGLPALMYLVRNIQSQKKPEGFDPIVEHINPKRNKYQHFSENTKALLNLFRGNRHS